VLPDGKTLAVSGINAALYDLTTGKEVARLKGKHGALYLAVSGDGRWLATADDRAGQVSLWDVRRRKRLWTITPWTAPAVPGWLALAFSPDGEALAAATALPKREVTV
jgi:WD40 repeat protein